jgi:predicted AlkP superfamily phosphohydrolase/phosphomutase
MKTIMVHFPGTWGIKGASVKEGYQVGGFAMGHYTVGEFGGFEIASSTLFTTEENIKEASRVELKVAEGWENLSLRLNLQPLETEINIWGTVFYLLVTGTDGKGYDEVHICRSKDLSKEVARISTGEWSKTVIAEFPFEKITKVGAFRFKLLKLSRDGKIFSLYVSPISPVEGFTEPDYIGKELTENFGAFPEREDLGAISRGWLDELSHFESCEYQVNWLSNVSKHLMKKGPWNMFFSEFHGVDHLSHFLVGNLKVQDPAYTRLSNPDYDEEKACQSLESLSKMYQLADRWIGEILKQANENTLIVVGSDHGIVPSHTQINLPYIFKESGLMDYEVDKNTGEMKINWSKTKAIQWERNFISVNLKGREPEGIVEPKDYDSVMEEVKDVLKNLEDPRTGESNIFTLFKKEEAEALGLYGDRVGDIFLLTKPGYVVWPIIKYVRPPRELKSAFGYPISACCHTFHWPTILDNRGFIVFAGPGVREGVRLKRPIRPPDVAPTITYLLDMSAPRREYEGRILFDALV